MNDKNENLDELLKRLYGDNAKEVGEDIAGGERILREHPDPKPDEETIILLKAKIAKAVATNRQRALRQTYYRVAAFAAAVIVIAFVGIALLEHRPMESRQVATTIYVTQGISRDDEFFNGDAEFETLSAEVEQIGNEIAALVWEGASESWDSEITELEMDLIEINSDFWKG